MRFQLGSFVGNSSKRAFRKALLKASYLKPCHEFGQFKAKAHVKPKKGLEKDTLNYKCHLNQYNEMSLRQVFGKEDRTFWGLCQVAVRRKATYVTVRIKAKQT